MNKNSVYTSRLGTSTQSPSHSWLSICKKTTVIAGLAIALSACSPSDPAAPVSDESTSGHHNMHSDEHHQHMADMDMNPSEPPEALGKDYSIYQIGGEWTDHKGNQLELDNLKGKNQVVVMAYTSCQHTCPILIRGMKQIENEMTPEARANTEFVLATLDTERDTVEVMNNYASHNQLGDNWHLIRSNEANTRMLANTLNIKYQFADNGDINHSNFISILDPEGRLVAQEIGIADSGIKPLVNYLNSHS